MRNRNAVGVPTGWFDCVRAAFGVQAGLECMVSTLKQPRMRVLCTGSCWPLGPSHGDLPGTVGAAAGLLQC